MTDWKPWPAQAVRTLFVRSTTKRKLVAKRMKRIDQAELAAEQRRQNKARKKRAKFFSGE